MATCKRPDCGHTMITSSISHGTDGKRAVLLCPYCRSVTVQLNDEDVQETERYSANPLRANTKSKKARAFEAIYQKHNITKGKSE